MTARRLGGMRRAGAMGVMAAAGVMTLAMGGAAQAVAPSVLYVATDGDDAGDCAAIATRCATVQRAVDVATGGEVIQIAGGSYTDADTGTAGQLVLLDQSVTLRGGYSASFTEPPDPAAHPTTLDAQQAGRVILIGSGTAVTIEGLVITGGMSSTGGGGIAATSAASVIHNNEIVGNQSDFDGGAIFINRGSAEITGNVIRQNQATWSGGMRLINDAAVTVADNEISENSADISGGGIDIDCCGGTTAQVLRNLVVGNDGGSRGGGILVQSTQAVLVNNVIAENMATEGANVRVEGQDGYPATVTSTHDTLVGKPLEGEGVRVEAYATVSLVNDIVAAHPTGIANADPLSATVTADHTLFDGNTVDHGAGVTSTNAISGSPSFVDAAGGDYHILPGSAARDAGTDAGVTDDRDGDPRPLGVAPDIGADEYVPPGVTTSTTTSSVTTSSTTSSTTTTSSSTTTSSTVMPSSTTTSSTTSTTATSTTTVTSTTSSTTTSTNTTTSSTTTSSVATTTSSTTTSSTVMPSSTTTSSTTSTTATSTTTVTSTTSSSVTTTLPPSSTTTTSSVTTTSTTLATEVELLPGTRLLLTDKPEKPVRRRMKFVSKDRALTLGGGPGSTDDPSMHDGSLRVVAAGVFDKTYPLAADLWRPLKRKKPDKGWRYGRGDPIRKVLLKRGQVLKVVGKGAALGHDLSEEPAAVDVVLTLGEHRYCARFEDAKKYKRGRKYVAKKAGAPQACPGRCGDGIVDTAAGEECEPPGVAGCDAFCRRLAGGNASPAATVWVDAPTGVVPHTVTLHADAFDPEGAPLQYAWDFGDGTFSPVDAGATVTHVYDTPGTYRPAVLVSDGELDDTAFVLVDAGVETVVSEVDAAGGTAALGSFGISVPADVLEQPTSVAVVRLPSQPGVEDVLDPARFRPIGESFRVAGGFATAEPMTVRLEYDPDAVPAGFDPANLAVLTRLDPGFEDPPDGGPAVLFVPLPSVVDTVAHTVETAVFAPGVFQLVAMAAPLVVFEEPVTQPLGVTRAGTAQGVGASPRFRVVVIDPPSPPEREVDLAAELMTGLGEALVTYLGMGFDVPTDLVTIFTKVLPADLGGKVNRHQPRHIVIDPVKPIPRRRIVAHEYFHVIQLWNTNVASLDVGARNAWFLEGSAEWAEDEVLDAVAGEYLAPTGERFTLPLNRRLAKDHRHYETVAFWKWLAAQDPSAIRRIVDAHRGRTHSLIGPTSREDNGTAALYLDDLTQVVPGIDWLEFATAALYHKDFDTDETGAGDLWTDDALGAAKNDVPPWFRESAQDRVEIFRRGAPGDSEANPRLLAQEFVRHLSSDVLGLQNPADSGLAGILHVRFDEAIEPPAQVALISRATQAEQRERDLSSEREVTMGFAPAEEVVLIGVDPEPGDPDPDGTAHVVSADAWVEPCGGTPSGREVTVPCCSVGDLITALEAAQPGDTVRLGAGEWRAPGRQWTEPDEGLFNFPASLVVWRGVTLGGTRDGASLLTTLRLTGSDSGLLAIDGSVIRDIRIRPEWWQGILTLGHHDLALCTVELFGGSELLSGIDFVVVDGQPGRLDVFDSVLECLGSCDGSGIEVRNYSPVAPGPVTVRTRASAISNWWAGLTYYVGPDEPAVVLDVDCENFRGNDNGTNVLEQPAGTDRCAE